MNPFVFHRPLEPSSEDSGVERPAERKLLLELIEGGQAARLTAPRRYGKSTLLKAIAADARGEHGFATAYVDFSRLLNLDDAAARIARAYEHGLEGALKATWRYWAREADVALSAGPLSLSRRGPAREGLERLHALLDFPLRLYEDHGTRSLVIFDEFQDLLTADPSLDGLLRSHLQHHGQAASYLFAGSQAGMFQALFADRRRPLFEQARSITIGPLPDAALGRWIADRFHAHGLELEAATERALLATAAGHPQRAVMLAHFTYGCAIDGLPGAAGFDRARRRALSEATEGLAATWDRLDRTHRQAIATVAAGHVRLLGRPALEFARIPKSSMVGARDALLARGDLLQEADGSVRLADPFLGIWLREPGAG